VAPVPGKNLQLTIDLELQQAVSQILRDGIRFSNEDRAAIAAVNANRPFKQESKAGAVVAIDPRSGEVLAMVSYPHFDNQLFVDGISQRKYEEYLDQNGPRPLVDRALRGTYPPGSTCKVFIAASALQEGKITPETTFNCTGAIRLPLEYNEAEGNYHPCWLKSGHSAVNVYDAIERSCDVFFYNTGPPKVALESRPGFLHYYDVLGYDTEEPRIQQTEHVFDGLGINLILKNLSERFWFGETTKIDLPAEDPASTLWETHAKGEWGAGQTILASIGQGFFLVTPLQLALNTAALANGGKIYRPRLISQISGDRGDEVEQSAPELLREMDLRPEIFDVVKEGMRRVVQAQTGTANRNLDQSSKWALTNPSGEPEIVVAGKTGTAEIGVPDEFGNYDRQHALFTCFAPLDNPEIAVSVIVEDGGEGSSYAVPVADRVLRAYFETTGRRGRGKVLRPEGSAPAPDGSVLSPTAAFPRPGLNAVPGAVPVD
jgi:penicillin-binding protein 2